MYSYSVLGVDSSTSIRAGREISIDYPHNTTTRCVVEYAYLDTSYIRETNRSYLDGNPKLLSVHRSLLRYLVRSCSYRNYFMFPVDITQKNVIIHQQSISTNIDCMQDQHTLHVPYSKQSVQTAMLLLYSSTRIISTAQLSYVCSSIATAMQQAASAANLESIHSYCAARMCRSDSRVRSSGLRSTGSTYICPSRRRKSREAFIPHYSRYKTDTNVPPGNLTYVSYCIWYIQHDMFCVNSGSIRSF